MASSSTSSSASTPPYPSAARISDSQCYQQYTASLKCKALLKPISLLFLLFIIITYFLTYDKPVPYQMGLWFLVEKDVPFCNLFVGFALNYLIFSGFKKFDCIWVLIVLTVEGLVRIGYSLFELNWRNFSSFWFRTSFHSCNLIKRRMFP